MSRFARFVRDLGSVELNDRATNQYSSRVGDVRENAIRRRNLHLYLKQMDAIAPAMLLVGEAVSYRGGRLTGIAFVSEALMIGGVETASGRILGSTSGYRKATAGPKLSTEASATMVWATIAGIDPLPLLWNAFPFHPFHAGDPLSNRAPSTNELLTGSHFLGRLLRLFPFRTIVAVGNHASRSLARLGVDHARVRHPSQGGKNQFVAGMAQLSQLTKP